MTILEIGGNTYRIGAMDAFTQLNIAKRLAPMSLLIEGMVDEANKDKDKTMLVVLMLGQLSDEDSNIIVNKCLSTITIQQQDTWSKILAPSGALMFDFIKMKDMVDLTSAVIVEHLGDFFHTALSKVKAGAVQKS